MMALVGDSRFCSKCKKLKPLTEFYKDAVFPCGHRPECKVCRLKFLKTLRKTNSVFRISGRLRARIYKAMKGKTKPGSAVRDLGCTVADLTKHLEAQFKPGMSWNNYGKWHIDHIMPLSSFDLTKRAEFLKACHFTNLQPLWAEENRQKWNKLPA